MFAFLGFCLVAATFIYRVFSWTDSSVLRVLACTLSVSQPLSYLIVALTNPGIITSQPNCENIEQVKYCKECRFNVEKSTYHCKLCDVCIEEYDHHCPWVSKCVGKGNLRAFHLFLLLTLALLFATMISYVGKV